MRDKPVRVRLILCCCYSIDKSSYVDMHHVAFEVKNVNDNDENIPGGNNDEMIDF